MTELQQQHEAESTAFSQMWNGFEELARLGPDGLVLWHPQNCSLLQLDDEALQLSVPCADELTLQIVSDAAQAEREANATAHRTLLHAMQQAEVAEGAAAHATATAHALQEASAALQHALLLNASVHGEVCCACSDVPEHVGGGLLDGKAAKRGRPSIEERELKERKKAALGKMWTGYCSAKTNDETRGTNDETRGSTSGVGGADEAHAPSEEQQAQARADAGKEVERAAAAESEAAALHREAERQLQLEALRAQEAAALAELQQQQAEAAAQAANGIKVALPAPKGRLPQNGEPLEAGRMGASVSLAPQTDARYEDSGAFSIYATAVLPRRGASGQLTGWLTKKDKVVYTAKGATPQERAADASAEGNRLAWKLLNQALRQKGPPRRRKGKAPAEDEGEQQPARRGRAAATEERGGSSSTNPASNDARATHNHGLPGNSGGRPVRHPPAGCGLGHGQPAVNSALFCPLEQRAPSALVAMLRAAQDQVRLMRLQLAQQRTTIAANDVEMSELRRDLAGFQRWAAAQLVLPDAEGASPSTLLPDILGNDAGYSPTERSRTIYNHYYRAFEAVNTITGGDLQKIRELFDYAANRLNARTTSSISARQLSIQSGVMQALRESFTAAQQRIGRGRPPKKLAQALQVALTWVARAPELGGVSMAAVADALSLGPNGVEKLSLRVHVADDFTSTGVFEQIYDDRCLQRSDTFSQKQIDWLVHDCWLSDDFTRESQNKGDEVFDPKSRKEDRKHHRKRYLELPLGEFYCQVQERGKKEFGNDFHMSSWFIRKHRPFWVKETTRDVCLCRYHLEFDLLAKGFHQLRVAVPCPLDCATCKAIPPLTTGLQLRAHLTCPRPEGDTYDAPSCVFGNCGRCSDLQLLGTTICSERREAMKEHRLKWERYSKEHVGQDLATGEDKYKHDFYEQEGTGEELIDDIKTTLSKFNPHHDLAKQQDADWGALKRNFPPGSFVSVQA